MRRTGGGTCPLGNNTRTLKSTAGLGQQQVNTTPVLTHMKLSWLGPLIAILMSSDVWACSCGLQTLEDHVKRADAIYLATLQEAKVVKGEYGKEWPYIEGTFHVRKTLKGQAQSGAMVLTTPVESSACGVSMMVSASYVIFKENGQSGIVACDGSTVIEPFQEDEDVTKVRAMLQKRKPASSGK